MSEQLVSPCHIQPCPRTMLSPGDKDARTELKPVVSLGCVAVVTGQGDGFRLSLLQGFVTLQMSSTFSTVSCSSQAMHWPLACTSLGTGCTAPCPCGLALAVLVWHGMGSPSLSWCGARRWQNITQDGCTLEKQSLFWPLCGSG